MFGPAPAVGCCSCVAGIVGGGVSFGWFAAADRARDAAAARFTAADRQLFDTVVHYRRPENSRTSHSTPSGGSASTSVGSISLSQSQYLRAESMSTCSDASSPKPK